MLRKHKSYEIETEIETWNSAQKTVGVIRYTSDPRQTSYNTCRLSPVLFESVTSPAKRLPSNETRLDSNSRTLGALQLSDIDFFSKIDVVPSGPKKCAPISSNTLRIETKHMKYQNIQIYIKSRLRWSLDDFAVFVSCISKAHVHRDLSLTRIFLNNII